VKERWPRVGALLLRAAREALAILLAASLVGVITGHGLIAAFARGEMLADLRLDQTAAALRMEMNLAAREGAIATVDLVSARRLLMADRAVFLDCRNTEEYASGHVAGALRVGPDTESPEELLEGHLSERGRTPHSATVFVILYDNGESARAEETARRLLSDHGRQVLVLETGYPEWEASMVRLRALMARFWDDPRTHLVVRLGVGALFIWGGAGKISDPLSFAAAVDGYGLIPLPLVGVVVAVMPWMELFFGLALVSGVAVGGAALGGALLMTVFLGALLSVLGGSGVQHTSCGCFSGVDRPIGWGIVVEDTAILVALLFTLLADRVVLTPARLLKRLRGSGDRAT